MDLNFKKNAFKIRNFEFSNFLLVVSNVYFMGSHSTTYVLISNDTHHNNSLSDHPDTKLAASF